MMKNKLKKQDGVISVFAMLAMLFFLLFILGAYLTISRKNRTQKMANEELLNLYNTDVNAQDLYNDLVAEVNEVIPIYSFEHLEQVDKNSFYCINNKIYFFKNMLNSYGKKDSESYELKSNLSVGNTDRFSKVYKGRYQYTYLDNLNIYLDGENNNDTLDGHSDTQRFWPNLIDKTVGGVGSTVGKLPLYAGGNNYNLNPIWEKNGLFFSGGAGNYVYGNAGSPRKGETIEVVLKTSSDDEQYILGNASGGIRLKNIDGSMKLVGNMTLNPDLNSEDVYSGSASKSVEKNVITHVALTYDGSSLKLYKNGDKIADTNRLVSDYVEIKTDRTYSYSDDKFSTTLGLNAAIESDSVIKITPYFIGGSPSYVPVNYSTGAGSKVIENGNSSYGTLYSNDIVSLSSINTLRFNYHLQYSYQELGPLELTDPSLPEGPTNPWIRRPITKYKDFNILTNSNNIGTNLEDHSIVTMAVGSNSFIVKSNVGKVYKWYFKNSLGSTTVVEKTPDKEIQLYGQYYYSFSGLDPNTSYYISVEIRDGKGILLKEDSGKTYIGRSVAGAEGSFIGTIYSVRVYDTALPDDSIKTNYKIDKSKYSMP